MLHDLISKLDSSFDSASAHCDIPCGIYDARTVMYHAVSTLRQIDILLSLKDKGLSETGFAMQVARNTAEKEAQAELTKHEVRIIWGDFINTSPVSGSIFTSAKGMVLPTLLGLFSCLGVLVIEPQTSVIP